MEKYYMKAPSREPQTLTLLSALKAHFLYLCCCLNISVWFANHRTFLSFLFGILLHSAQPSWFRSGWAKVSAWLPPFFHNIFLLNLFSVLWNVFGPPMGEGFWNSKAEGDTSPSSIPPGTSGVTSLPWAHEKEQREALEGEAVGQQEGHPGSKYPNLTLLQPSRLFLGSLVGWNHLASHRWREPMDAGSLPSREAGRWWESV